MYTVIVADDEFGIRQSLINRVNWSQIGFKVIGEAENGVEALELVEKLEPDLLLTDIKMPFISGIDLARKVREIRPAMQIAFLSGYDDFSYAQQAIQYNIIKYLLKPISSQELSEELLDIKNKMDAQKQLFISNIDDVSGEQLNLEHFLMPLLLDDDIATINNYDTQEINWLDKHAIDCGLRESLDDKAHYVVIVISLIDQDDNDATDPKQRLAIEAILEKYINFGCFYTANKIVALLSGQVWQIEKYLNIAVNEIVQRIERALGFACYIGVSGMVDNLIKTNGAYHEATSALQYAMGAKKNIVYIEDIEKPTNITYEYIAKVAKHIEGIIKTGTKTEIEEYLKIVFIEIINDNISRADIDMLMIQLLSSISAVVYSVCDISSSTNFFSEATDYSSMLKTHSFNEKKEALQEFCIKAQTILANQKKLNSEIICDELMAIINDDYSDENLSLVSVSERLHVSSNYLSSLVKKTMGSSFVTLLTNKRMDIAKDLVLCSSLKILEIAYKCGYSDQHYFSYCFKKRFGLSPNKMREMNNEKKI